jgi:ParB family transcriptional regulator, chromosome partitioning protein
MAEEIKPRLGRGLAALLGEAAEEAISPVTSNSGLKRVPIEQLRPNARNPRKTFSEDNLEELAHSIRDRGVLQPIIVRAMRGEGATYEIVAGERRWRAAQRAGVHDLPVVVVDATDKQALEIAIVENVQRTDLNPLEEAEGYNRLIGEFEYSHHDLGQAIGKSRSYVSNALRLLKLPEQARSLLAKGEISAGHARALLSLPDPDSVARDIVSKGLSVRDVEQLAQEPRRELSPERQPQQKPQSPEALQVERSLAESLGMSVSLRTKGESGELRIRFSSLEQLDLLCNRLQS